MVLSGVGREGYARSKWGGAGRPDGRSGVNGTSGILGLLSARVGDAFSKSLLRLLEKAFNNNCNYISLCSVFSPSIHQPRPLNKNTTIYNIFGTFHQYQVLLCKPESICRLIQHAQ